MNDLQVELPCECGAKIVAKSHNAGTAVSCQCGRFVSVPSLGRLRAMAGGEAYVTNPAEAIRKALNAGQRIAGEICLICKSPRPRNYLVEVVCERSFVKRGGGEESNSVPALLAQLFIPMAEFFRSRSRATEVRGHDIVLDVPIPVCQACVESGNNPLRPRKARRLMREVAAYKNLLDYYPKARIGKGRAEPS